MKSFQEKVNFDLNLVRGNQVKGCGRQFSFFPSYTQTEVDNIVSSLKLHTLLYTILGMSDYVSKSLLDETLLKIIFS